MNEELQRNILTYNDIDNSATPFIKNFQGSSRAGKTIRVEKSEQFFFLNNIDKKIFAFKMSRQSYLDHVVIEQSDDKKSTFVDFQPLSNMRLLTLDSKGLLTLWKYNVFKKKTKIGYTIKIKRKKNKGDVENFESMVICEREHYIAISTSIGKERRRSRLLMFWVMDDQDYMYQLAELDFFDLNVRENNLFGKNGKGSAFVGISFFGYVGNFPVLYAQEFSHTGTLYSFYFREKEIRIFKPPRFYYHKAGVVQLVRDGNFLWSIDITGKINRMSLEE